MSLNRNQMTLCIIGGVFAVGAGALGWLLWSAIGESSEVLEERDNSRSSIESYLASKVAPTEKSVDAINANANELAMWRSAANLRVSRGDKSFAATTPPSFKQFLQLEQVRLSGLPGSAAGKICKPGFAFGFDKYLGQNPTMPEAADLPKLQRQLDFIAEAVELFAEAGVGEITKVTRDTTSAQAVEEPQPAQRRSGGRNNDRRGRAAEDEGPVVTSQEYSFDFLASPKALVSVMNKLNSDLRFTVVTTLNFSESRDLVAESFAARDKAAEEAKSAQNSRRRRRRGDAAELLAEAQEDKTTASGVVIDPEIDAPLTVSLTVQVFDFGQPTAVAAPPSAAAPDEPQEPEASKAEPPAPAADAPADDAKPASENPAEEKLAAPAENTKEEAAK